MKWGAMQCNAQAGGFCSRMHNTPNIKKGNGLRYRKYDTLQFNKCDTTKVINEIQIYTIVQYS
jgi:hypothetical protein